MAEDRPADKILAEIKAVEMPKVPAGPDRPRGRPATTSSRRRRRWSRRPSLIGELYKAHPDAPELAKLLPERWQARMMPGAEADETKAEIDEVLATSKNEKLRSPRRPSSRSSSPSRRPAGTPSPRS